MRSGYLWHTSGLRTVDGMIVVGWQEFECHLCTQAFPGPAPVAHAFHSLSWLAPQPLKNLSEQSPSGSPSQLSLSLVSWATQRCPCVRSLSQPGSTASWTMNSSLFTECIRHMWKPCVFVSFHVCHPVCLVTVHQRLWENTDRLLAWRIKHTLQNHSILACVCIEPRLCLARIRPSEPSMWLHKLWAKAQWSGRLSLIHYFIKVCSVNVLTSCEHLIFCRKRIGLKGRFQKTMKTEWQVMKM